MFRCLPPSSRAVRTILSRTRVWHSASRRSKPTNILLARDFSWADPEVADIAEKMKLARARCAVAGEKSVIAWRRVLASLPEAFSAGGRTALSARFDSVEMIEPQPHKMDLHSRKGWADWSARALQTGC